VTAYHGDVFSSTVLTLLAVGSGEERDEWERLGFENSRYGGCTTSTRAEQNDFEPYTPEQSILSSIQACSASESLQRIPRCWYDRLRVAHSSE
jgi:hypothetical protein